MRTNTACAALPGPFRAQLERLKAAAREGVAPHALIEWYLEMAPCWLGVQPSLRRRLLLRTHQWIVERMLSPDSDLKAVAQELRPGGALSQTLAALVPPEQLGGWRDWIRLVVADLQRSLLRPKTRRNAAWAQWLFLIPYSIPLKASSEDRKP